MIGRLVAIETLLWSKFVHLRATAAGLPAGDAWSERSANAPQHSSALAASTTTEWGWRRATPAADPS